MVKTDKRNAVIFCTCEGEALRIQPDRVDEAYNLADISLLTYGCRDNKAGFKQKWHYIRHILKYGTPYGDQVCLGKEGRQMLIEALQAYDEPNKGVV